MKSRRARLILGRQNELKGNVSKTLAGVLQITGVYSSTSQTKKQIFNQKNPGFKRNEAIFAIKNRIKSNLC